MPVVESWSVTASCWADLGTTDLPDALAFYGELFGWDAEAVSDPQAGSSAPERRAR